MSGRAALAAHAYVTRARVYTHTRTHRKFSAGPRQRDANCICSPWLTKSRPAAAARDAEGARAPPGLTASFRPQRGGQRRSRDAEVFEYHVPRQPSRELNARTHTRARVQTNWITTLLLICLIDKNNLEGQPKTLHEDGPECNNFNLNASSDFRGARVKTH